MSDRVKKIERSRRRAVLQVEEDALRRKINQANELIMDFRRHRDELIQMIRYWHERKDYALSSQMFAQVRVSRKFEGVIAESRADELPEGTEAMDENIRQLEGIVSGIEDQISRLSKYQDLQENNLFNLRRQITQIMKGD